MVGNIRKCYGILGPDSRFDEIIVVFEYIPSHSEMHRIKNNNNYEKVLSV